MRMSPGFAAAMMSFFPSDGYRPGALMKRSSVTERCNKGVHPGAQNPNQPLGMGVMAEPYYTRFRMAKLGCQCCRIVLITAVSQRRA